MRGTLEIRRRFRGFGPLRLASGTRDRRVFRRLNELLTALYEGGRFDWLRALEARRIHPLALLALARGIVAADLPKPEARDFTPEAVRAWADTQDVSASHRADLRQHLRRLAARAERIAGIPDALRDLKELYRKRGQAVAFHHLRAAAMTYLRETVGRRHPVYREVEDVQLLRARRKREGHPCTVPEAFAIAAALGPFYGPTWLTMCLSGVGLKELWQDGMVRDGATGHLRVFGEKVAGRRRMLLRVEVVVGGQTFAPETGAPAMGAGLFRRRLRAVTGAAVQPYDGRRTFAVWAALARVPEIHIDAYLGHGPRSMTRLYQRGGERPYLDRDAGLMAAFIEGEIARTAGMSPDMLPDVALRLLSQCAGQDGVVSEDAPPVNRTRNLLIKSQIPARAIARNEAQRNDIARPTERRSAQQSATEVTEIMPDMPPSPDPKEPNV